MEPLVSTIRQSLNLLTVLPSAARAVLIEVCELVENGGKGKCFAGNQHLANAACCHPISVSKHLGLLKKTGLLIEHFPNGNPAARTLTPSAEVVAAYTSGDLSTLSRVLREGKQGAKGTLSRVLTDPKQGANHTHIHKEETEQLHGEVSTLRAAVVEKDGRLAKAAEQYRADQQIIADLKTQLAKLEALSAPKPPKFDKVAVEAPELGFDAFWNTYDKKKGSKSNTKRLWEKLAADTRRHILNGLVDYKAGIREKQYQPHPETFLNGKEWEAETYGIPAQKLKVAAAVLPQTKVGIGGRIASNMTMRAFDDMFAPGASTAKEPIATYGQSTLKVS